MPTFLSCWVPLVPAWLAPFFFSSPLAHSDSFVLNRWSLSIPEARCLRPTGMLELLAPCTGVSELPTPEGRVLNVTSGGFLTAGSSLPLAETSTASFLVAPVPLDGAPEQSAYH
jgi:hypothetical protein